MSQTKQREFYFQFHINRNCNLRCSHCYQENYKVKEPYSDASLFQIGEHILSALKQWNYLGRIALTGGEPFLCPSLWPLLDMFNSSDLVNTLTILSNGTLIDEEQTSRLALFSKLREVQISLDGAGAETHDNIRGKGSFARAIDGIRRLKKAGIPVAIMFTLMPQNMTEATNLLELAKYEKVEYVTIERVVPCQSSGRTLGLISPEDLHRAYREVHAWAENQPDGSHKVTVRRRRPLWVLFSEELGGFCPAGFSSLAILEEGTILPCRRMEIPIGNVLLDGGLFKAWYTSDVLWRLRKRTELGGKCGSCNYVSSCGGCRAVAYSVLGDYMQGDPQCWLNQTTC